MCVRTVNSGLLLTIKIPDAAGTIEALAELHALGRGAADKTSQRRIGHLPKAPRQRLGHLGVMPPSTPPVNDTGVSKSQILWRIVPDK